MTFIDLFAGVGGFRRGMELAGHTCKGFCEFDEFATASYTSMHLLTDEQKEYLATLPKTKRQKEILKETYRNGEWYAKDIRTVTGFNVPRVDCWCFGAPCQDFSIAGRRAGLEGDRSSLIGEIFRILGEMREADRPEWLIYENVKGMLSSNRGWDFFSILCEMDRWGYDVQWQLLNTKYHGVPQNRERVYTVGHLRRYGRRKVFPFRISDETHQIEPLNQIGSYVGLKRQNPNQYRVYNPEGISPTLTGIEPCIGIKIDIVGSSQPESSTAIGQNYLVYGARGISGCLNAGDYKQPHQVAIPLNGVCIPVLTPDREEKRQNGRRFKEDGDDMFTLTAQDKHGVAIGILGGIGEPKEDGSWWPGNQILDSVGISPTLTAQSRGRAGGATGLFAIPTDLTEVTLSNGKTVPAIWYDKYKCYVIIRKLTPRECFRLQGWTDDYFERAEFVNSDTQLYKQAGNGVTVEVVRAVAEAINSSKERAEEKQIKKVELF